MAKYLNSKKKMVEAEDKEVQKLAINDLFKYLNRRKKVLVLFCLSLMIIGSSFRGTQQQILSSRRRSRKVWSRDTSQ